MGESAILTQKDAANVEGYDSSTKVQALVFGTNPMNELGKLLVMLGAVIVLIGLFLWTGLGRSWLGQLPGDIHYKKSNFSFHFPVVTCLLISVALTLLIRIFRK